MMMMTTIITLGSKIERDSGRVIVVWFFIPEDGFRQRNRCLLALNPGEEQPLETCKTSSETAMREERKRVKKWDLRHREREERWNERRINLGSV